MKAILFVILSFKTCVQLTLGVPLELLSMVPARNYDVPPPPLHGNHVHVGEPRLVPERDSDTFICLVQEIDGNFCVRRSLSAEDCQNEVGDIIYESGIHLPLSDETYEYFTRMQWSGNLFTRKFDNERESGSIGVWKTISPQWFDHKAFALVLNDDDTLSILFENTTSIWNSATGETCVTKGTWGNTCAPTTAEPVTTATEPVTTTVQPMTTIAEPHTTTAESETTASASRPLVLMKAGSRVSNDEPIAVPDSVADMFVCVFQQANANFIVSRGENCESISSIMYQSCLTLSGIEAYYTRLQRNGDLATRREDSREVVWRSRSGQGKNVKQDFTLVLVVGDTLAILDENGNPVWDSAQDKNCTPTNSRKRW